MMDSDTHKSDATYLSSRLKTAFNICQQENRAALVTFTMSGDPDFETSLALMEKLPTAGADIIELGMPFTDPMADGETIQAAGRRALSSGQTLRKTLEMVKRFRQNNDTTPVILMGYYNPIYIYGVTHFLHDASTIGIDGLIIVDLPIEEDKELQGLTCHTGLDFIRLTTPTTTGTRLEKICHSATGFLYHIGVAGVTGARNASQEILASATKQIKLSTNLPVCVGFGIKTPEDVAQAAQVADGVVVGSAIVERVARGDTPEQVAMFVSSLRERVSRQENEQNNNKKRVLL